MTQTERGRSSGAMGNHGTRLGTALLAEHSDPAFIRSPRSVCVTLVSDPSALSLGGLRPSHQRGTPPLLPERSAACTAFDREGSDQLEPGTNAQRGSGTSLIRKETETPCRGTSVSGCRPGSTNNNKARAAHLCGERRADQGGTS